jgi:mannose-6-phosphate isomerase-like protein (cupin superfamily)/DNA-binding XRE family transcriptional regulator
MEGDHMTVVGARIRQLRRQSGKTLREQASELGISASSLSVLENGRGGVSLARLQRVARHFGLSVTDLLAGPAPAGNAAGAPEVFRGTSLPLSVSRGHGARYQLLGTPSDHELQPYLLSFEPGGGFEKDAIAHAGEEFAYVIFGRVELLYAGESLGLGAGDAVRFRTTAPHAFRNPSETSVAIVVGAATPPW